MGRKEGAARLISDVDNLLQFGGRHRMEVRERGTLPMEQPRAASYSEGRRLARSRRTLGVHSGETIPCSRREIVSVSVLPML